MKVVLCFTPDSEDSNYVVDYPSVAHSPVDVTKGFVSTLTQFDCSYFTVKLLFLAAAIACWAVISQTYRSWDAESHALYIYPPL